VRLHLTPLETARFHALTTLRVCLECNSVHVLADFDRRGNCRPRSAEQVGDDRLFLARARSRIVRLGSQPCLTRRGD
jgi:hypothetical protein